MGHAAWITDNTWTNAPNWHLFILKGWHSEWVQSADPTGAIPKGHPNLFTFWTTTDTNIYHHALHPRLLLSSDLHSFWLRIWVWTVSPAVKEEVKRGQNRAPGNSCHVWGQEKEQSREQGGRRNGGRRNRGQFRTGEGDSMCWAPQRGYMRVLDEVTWLI